MSNCSDPYIGWAGAGRLALPALSGERASETVRQRERERERERESQKKRERERRRETERHRERKRERERRGGVGERLGFRIYI